MSAGPLRALVTRPAQDAGPLFEGLAALGIEAVAEPLLTIEPNPEITLELTGAQAVLLTSRNGARALAAACAARDIAVLAVGDATAAEARAAGFETVISAGGSVEGLERLAASRLDPGSGRLVHVSGDAVAGDLSGALSAKGFSVDRPVLYKAIPATRLSVSTLALISEGRLAMALFFSPRTAATFATLAREAAIEASCANIHAVFISPAAAEAASDLPWRETWCAATPDLAGLIISVAAAKHAIDPTGCENG